MSSVASKPDVHGDPERNLYQRDEYAWIEKQIAALRNGRLRDIDRENLAEYLSDMAARDRRELDSRFGVLLQHLLKLHMQPARMTRSWLRTIKEQQREIRKIYRELPSIAQHANRLFSEAYRDAVEAASDETGIPAERFSPTSPWTIEEALAFKPEMPVQAARRRKTR